MVAYELLYRGSRDARTAVFPEGNLAALRVMANTFASLGEAAVLGGHLGFFNVTRAVLLSDALLALPRESVVIELLEDIPHDREVEERCRSLRAAGYRIALDDWVLDDPRKALLPFADIVKVDLLAVEPRALRRLARSLRGDGRLLLAEKVESQEQFEACHRIGFDRFQGYFFARPTVLEGVGIDPSQTTLLRLMQLLGVEADTAEIVESFKQDAKLGLSLLRIVNTAGNSTGMRLESIDDGVRHLGLRQLTRWISVLLYAQGRGGGGQDPLLATAAHRGRLMELVAGAASRRGIGGLDAERAFLVGMLSLADALLGRSLDQIVKELRLAPEVVAALCAREGPLGRLLAFAEAAERGDLAKLESELAWLDSSFEELQSFDQAAYAWLHALQQSIGGVPA